MCNTSLTVLRQIASCLLAYICHVQGRLGRTIYPMRHWSVTPDLKLRRRCTCGDRCGRRQTRPKCYRTGGQPTVVSSSCTFAITSASRLCPLTESFLPTAPTCSCFLRGAVSNIRVKHSRAIDKFGREFSGEVIFLATVET